MGLSFFLVAVFLLHATAGGEASLSKGNNSLYLSANQELSAAALNVKVSFQPYDETWNTFKAAFGRQYRSQVEEAYRYETFLSNVKKIELHNTKFQNGQGTYWMGVNQFADMSVEEYRAYNRLRPAGNKTAAESLLRCSPFLSPLYYAVPDSVDWRQKGYVTPVKDQEQCGSCWAFSTTGSLEGQHYRKTGHLVSLSEQQLVDCATPFGPQGCKGGNEPPAYAYIASVGGIDSEISYPYEGQDGPCRFSKSKVAATLTGCRLITQNSEKDLQLAVSSQGPISVNIDASHDSFQFYSGGVYVEPRCGKTTEDLDHAVLAVGYGYTGAHDYWIVKNSWGQTWGAQGYILMARNHDNMCGIATEANFPVV